MKYSVRYIAYILVFITIITSCGFSFMFTSIAEESFNVNNANDLLNLKSNIEGSTSSSITVNIKNDIDASSIAAVTAINASSKTITFNGGNFLISNLNIVGSGLFSAVGSGSSFSNIGFYDCYLSEFDAASANGFGILCGTMASGTVTNCFADGKIVVYGTPSEVGGLIGSFGGSSMTNCFAMTDIYTDGSYVGGLIGRYTGSKVEAISCCYSTGSLNNKKGCVNIGGLIGYSAVSCVKNSYTSMCILNPYADTVKSIGVIADLSDTVYYDENLSLQKQGDLDKHRCSPSELSEKLSSNGWTAVSGYYPQLTAFYGSAVESYNRISAISAAVVDIDRNDGITTGREFTIVSSTNRYSFATLTRYDSTKHSSINSKNLMDWHISGGIDEYYFDPEATEQNFPTNSGNLIDGLSGNTYDANTGKYLFVNTGDVKFTAYSGGYSRDIYVQVTTSDKNPYITGGTGTASDPFIISDINEFDMIRVYCLDDETGRYHYSLDSQNDTLSFSGKDWLPIIGMKGTLLGNDHTISGLNIVRANEGNAGLFATISSKSISTDNEEGSENTEVINTNSISNFYISNATVAVSGADNIGILSGTAENVNVSNVMATGNISSADNAAMFFGAAHSNVNLNVCLSMGLVSGVNNAGGFVGVTDQTVVATDCYSCAVVTDAKNVGGFYGSGDGIINTSLFTGMISSGVNGKRYGLTGGNGAINNAYFDWQAAGIHNTGLPYAKKTTDLHNSNILLSLGANWSLNASVAGKHYPQLNYFFNHSNKRILYTIGIATVSMAYKDALTDGSSTSFESVSFDARFRFNEIVNGANKQYATATVNPVAYGTDVNGYSVTKASNTVSITYSTGGKQIYTITSSNTTNAPTDTRYLLANVNSVAVYYKFSYLDKNGEATATSSYHTDMSNGALIDIETELGALYSAIFNSTVTTDYSNFGTIRATGDNLKFGMINAAKYDLDSIEAYYKDSNDTMQPLAVDINDDSYSIYVGSVNKVYLNFIIKENELPWGIYHINT